MIKAVVIDDIKKNRDAVKIAVSKYCPSIAIIGEASGVNEGVIVINELNPNLIFLDVEMQDGTGFDLLEKFSNPWFKVIFITGYEDYAFKAFKFNAFSYLLKPIDKVEFIAAVAKVEKQIETENLSHQINALVKQQEKTSSDSKKITLRTSDKIVAVTVADIIRCESENSYTTFYLTHEKKLVLSTSLKEFEDKLPHHFFRPHQSHLINLDYFDHYSKSDGGWIVLKDGSKIPLASRKKEEFLMLIENL